MGCLKRCMAQPHSASPSTPTAAYRDGPLTNPFNITHVYGNESLYNVSVVVEDLLITLRQRLPVVVAYLPCNAPVVWLPNGVSSPLEAPIVMRSRPFRVTAGATVECNGTVATKKSWTITKVEGDGGIPVEDVIVEGFIPSWNYSELAVPANFLDYGTYLFTYKLQLLASKVFPLFRTASTYMTVIKTPLQAVIIKGGMSKVSRGYGTSLVLDPHQYSLDPDWPDDKNFTYTWFCRTLTDPEHPSVEGLPQVYNTQLIPEPLSVAGQAGGGCFGQGPGSLDYMIGFLNLDTSSFTHADATYEIEVLIEKDTRFAVSRVCVDVLQNPPPSIEIKCADEKTCRPTFSGLLVNPSARVALQTLCSDYCHNDMEYSWSITTIEDQPVVEESTCTENCQPVLPTGKNSKDIAIGSELFRLNPGIEKFKVTLTVTTPSGTKGEYVMTLVLNKPPSGGSCDVKLSVGRALIDNFVFACTGWADPEEAGVDQYVFFMYVETIGDPLKETIVASTSPNANLILPIGKFTIFCEIWDKFGTYAEVTVGEAEATLPSQDEVEAFNTAERIEYLTAVGDQFTIGMLLKAQASVREHAPWLNLDMNALSNLTADEMEDRLKDVAKMNTESLKAAINTMNGGSLAQLNVMAGVMRTAVAGIDQAEQAAKTVDMEARDATMTLLKTMTDSLENVEVPSPQDLVPLLTSSLSAMSSIMSGVRRIIDGENVTNAPPTDVEAAENWDYEVDIGDDVNLEIPISPTVMRQKNVIDTTINRAKEQVNQMMNILATLVQEVRDRTVDGETVVAQSPNGASMRVAKMSEAVLLDGMKVEMAKGGGTAKLPPGFCPSNFENLEGCNRSFSITAIEWPGITHSYVPTSEKLSPNTRIISLDVFLEGQMVNASSVKEGIFIDIPRNPKELPEPILVTENKALETMGHHPLVYHAFNVTNENAAVNIEVSANGSQASRLVMLLGYNYLPTPARFELLSQVTAIPTNDKGVHDLLLTGDIIKSRTGRFFVAMGLVKEGVDAAALHANTTALTYDMLERKMEDYSLRIFTSGCYFFNDSSLMWSSENLEVVNATYERTMCRSTHLTAFGSRFFPTPNSISFEFIFANAGFLDNTAIYVTLAVTLFVFVCLLIVARIKDKQDVKKRGATALPDNNMEDRYLYEIVVYTGSDKNASCESKVQIILSGECGETEVRTLEDKNRKVFCRNGIDSFVMAEPRPLGDLQYLRVWHDNSGEEGMSSWQLAFISVRDLQTQRKTLFIANRWLSLDRDDGEIDVTFSTSSMDQLTNFSHLYEASKQRGIKDRHIWFSMFFRPPRSRYTRVERTAVCAAFIYLSMLCSAMWYSTIPDAPMGEGFLSIGPFSLTAEKAAVGLASLLIVYPGIQFIIWLFRRSGPRVRPYSRAFTARHEQCQQQREESGLPREELEEHTRVRDILSLSNTDESHERPFLLGWWGRLLAWLLVLAVIGVSVFFVWAYALQFGAEKTSRWLTSLIVTFLFSILVVEPLMVLFGAVVEASCCKRKKSLQVDVDDIDFDELEPDLEMDEEWQHLEPLDPTYPRKVHRIPGNKDTSILDELRVKLVKEREMTLVLRDVGAYLLFVFVVMILTYGERDESSYRMVENFRNAFIKEGDLKWDYKNKMKTTDHYWRWLKEVMLSELRAQNWYNGKPPYGLRGFLDDRQNRIMGHAILRQVRNNRECRPSNQVKILVSDCSGWRGEFLEDNNHYCAHWLNSATHPGACSLPEFRYSTAKELESFTSSGRLGSYTGGGYVLHLKGTSSELLRRLNHLQHLGWIDRYTRAVMLEFSVYNANVNLFGIATIMAEFHPGGGIRPYWRFDSSPFIRNSNAYGSFILLNELAFVLATIFFTFREFWKCYKSGFGVYFSSYWNMAEVVILLISYAAIAIYILRYLEVQRVLKIFDTTFGNGYIRMEYAALLDLYLLYAVGFIVFFTTVKFIKLLQFNKRMNLLGLTLSKCWEDLEVFFFTFGVIFFAFTTLFFTIFNLQLEEFSNFMACLQMSFAMMLGKFDFESMTLANYLSPVMFFVFSLSTSMILINLMLTIIIRTFTQIKNDLKNKPNKYDILDYITNRTMLFLNLRTEKPLPKVAPPVLDNETSAPTDTPASKEFPEKVDVLLAYINEMYFSGQMDFNDPYTKKSMMGSKSTKLYGKYAEME
ncbi:polycystin-1-like protein 2 isoform X1 [Scylla paramamosain]|uniref:polycystin-1-like protein 2 isoform X1 n=2 Tax=Scylla paramamosain TaxID=85552 RepID=UPI003083EAE1